MYLSSDLTSLSNLLLNLLRNLLNPTSHPQQRLRANPSPEKRDKGLATNEVAKQRMIKEVKRNKTSIYLSYCSAISPYLFISSSFAPPPLLHLLIIHP